MWSDLSIAIEVIRDKLSQFVVRKPVAQCAERVADGDDEVRIGIPLTESQWNVILWSLEKEERT